MQTFKERLASLWPGERQAKIAADIDMTMAGFSRIWHDGGLPKAETLKRIKELKGCSIDWLLTGEGEPFPVQVVEPAHDTLVIQLMRMILFMCHATPSKLRPAMAVW